MTVATRPLFVCEDRHTLQSLRVALFVFLQSRASQDKHGLSFRDGFENL